MDRWSGKIAVVTGASSGIGLAIAKELVKHGLVVVGLARRKDKMEKEMQDVQGHEKFHPIMCDVTNETEVSEAFQWIKNNLGTVNILINNAGTCKMGSIADLGIKEIQNTINLNVMGLLYCTKQAIELMKENGQDAHIVNINSIAGHKLPNLPPGMNINVYPATKFAVNAISQTLTVELVGSKIRVSNVSPGAVKTELMEESAKSTPPEILAGIPILEPEHIAHSVLHILSVPQNVLISEMTIRPLGEAF